MAIKKEINIYIIICCLIMGSCSNPGPENPERSNTTEASIQDSIQMILRNVKAGESTYENHTRMLMIQNQLERNPNNLNLMFPLAKELLNEGSTTEAIKTINQLFSRAPKLKTINDESLIFHKFLAVCHLRTAEQSNCQNNHTDESCIIPITGSGIHSDQSGSKKAIEKYLEILEVFPNDYQSIWLLNIAHMTLGGHPNKIPKQWQINISQKDVSQDFHNIASFTGTDHYGLSGSVIADDFNNDGLLDLIVSSWGFKGELKYYENQGNQGFHDRTSTSNLEGVKGGLNIRQADFNNDGNLDFFVLRGAWRPRFNWGILPNSLIKNNGDGTFTDVTIQSNLYSTRPTQSAEWFDFNNDGNLDLLVANETVDPSKEVYPSELFENKGDGTFEEVSKKYNAQAIGYFKGCNVGDINNDGLMDFYLSNLKGDNKLFLNEGKTNTASWSFKEISQQSGVTEPFASFPCWLMDIDNDGLEDISTFAYDPNVFLDLSGEFAKSMLDPKAVTLEKSKIYRNKGNLQFEDISSTHFDYGALGTMGCNYGDIDNDGYNDFYLGTGTPDYRSVIPNRFFMNQQGEGFVDRSFELGLGHIQKGHGISFADLDNDGDLDIYAVMGGAFEGDVFHNALFANPGNENSWIKMKLIGTKSNRSAIGAKIKLRLADSSGNAVDIYHKVSSGSSFGANPLAANLGIPADHTIEDIQVRWPNGSTEYVSYGKLNPRQYYVITEGENPVQHKLVPFDWKESNSGHEHHHH